MVNAQELSQACLLVAANGLAQQETAAYRPRAACDSAYLAHLPYGMRCALFMLVAFALRRSNLGRRGLRPASSNPNPSHSSGLRFLAYCATSFRARLYTRLAHFTPVLPYQRGYLALSYQ